MSFRQFSEAVYPALVRDQIILLNIRKNKFHILTPDVSAKVMESYLLNATKNFSCDGDTLFSDKLTEEDRYNLTARNNSLGISTNFWNLRSHHVSFSSVRQVAGLIILIHKAHSLIQKGLPYTLDYIDRTGIKTSNTDIKSTLSSLNAATILYPRKTKCLEWAVALILALRPRGVKVKLVIGVQNHPFYSHAWVECNGLVLNDDQDLSKNLAVIFEKQWGK